MRIPTLLGLALLIIAISLGTFLYFANQKSPSFGTVFPSTPNNIEVVNITDSQASIIWQTTQPSTGLVSWGTSNSLGTSQNDDRDTTSPQNHLTHFVTLSSLNPNTEYFFKVRSNLSFYPNENLSFKTSPVDTSSDKCNNKAIFGVILDPNLKPVSGALVILKINQASDLATLSTSTGNFLLSLVDLKTNDLRKAFIVNNNLPATLIIYTGTTSDQVKFTLPLNNKPLPKIILGADNDFTQLTATFSAQLNATPGANLTNPFDINKDGTVNFLDLITLMRSYGKRQGDPGFNPATDLNHDGVVNQFDRDLLLKALR